MSVQDVPRDTMRCTLAAAHGDDIDALLYIRDDYPKPERKEGEVLIKVHACALAPGDVRVLRGHCDYWQEPPKFPYIPGGDLSGTVVETDASSRFKEGDAVMVMFELPRPLNGLAEFISAKEELVEMAPKSVPLMLASTLPSSALSAMIATNKYVKQGDRILVLGGGGGVGTFFVQMAKAKGASYIAVTSSTDKEWLMPALGADTVVDYTKSDWWDDEDLLSGGPVDLVVDMAIGKEAWDKVRQAKMLHRRGTFLAFSADPVIELHNLRQTCSVFGRVYLRQLWTKFWPCSPRYLWLEDGLELKPGRLAEVAQMVDDGMHVVLDPVSPLPFTEEGVKRGFHVMRKRHAHGKVVVAIQD